HFPNNLNIKKTRLSLRIDGFLNYTTDSSLWSHFIHLIVTFFFVRFSTKRESHSGHGFLIGLSQETKSHSGYWLHPYKTRPLLDLRSTTSPSLHFGHGTPIVFNIGFVFRQSGKFEQAKNFPYLPIL